MTDQPNEDFWAGADDFYDLPTRSVVDGVYPELRRIADESGARRILDFGCGSGRLLSVLDHPQRRLFGCDINRHARRLAADRLSGTARITSSLDELVGEEFDLTISCMVAMTLPSYETLLQTLSKLTQLTRRGGRVATAVTHPCFRSGKFSDFATDWRTDSHYFDEERPFEVRVFDDDSGRLMLLRDYHYSLRALYSAHRTAGLIVDDLIELADPKADPSAVSPAFLIVLASRPNGD